MPEKNLLKQEREPRTNSTHIWRQRQDSNLNHPIAKLKSTVKLQVVAAVSFSMQHSSKQTVFFLFFFISGIIKLVFSSCFYMTSMMYF